MLPVMSWPCVLTSLPSVLSMQASYEEKETGHRVIVGREYYEPFGLEPQEVVGRAITHLIRKKVPRQTEGAPAALLHSCQLASSTPHTSPAVHHK